MSCRFLEKTFLIANISTVVLVLFRIIYFQNCYERVG